MSINWLDVCQKMFEDVWIRVIQLHDKFNSIMPLFNNINLIPNDYGLFWNAIPIAFNACLAYFHLLVRLIQFNYAENEMRRRTRESVRYWFGKSNNNNNKDTLNGKVISINLVCVCLSQQKQIQQTREEENKFKL